MSGSKVRLFCGVAALFFCLGCGVGNVAFREGRKAELRKDWDTALIKYQKAVQAEPENPEYLIREKLARMQASLLHLKQGRRFLAEGRRDEAVGEFQKAAAIDPTNEAAAQELTQQLALEAAEKRAREKALQEGLKAREEPSAPIGVQLKPFPAEPLAHFRVSGDSRRVFETLGKLADLNVAFTADFQPRPVSVDLTNVTIEEALRVVAYQTKTFWKSITPNTILIIPDNPANRRDYEEEVLKTVYLANPLTPADRTAITTALKQILGLQRIIDNPDANAIIVRDTPAKVMAAEELIRGLDRGKAEILIEVGIVEADRDRIRDLGMTLLPTAPLPSTAVAALGFTPTKETTGGTGDTNGTTIPAVPLDRLGDIRTRDFSIVLPGVLANALLTDSHTRILQNPQVRVTDGQTAKLRIGTRIPFATGSFLPGVSGVGAGGFNLLASTQFQYQDVGVNLDITPRLMANGEVSLRALIEISSVAGVVNIGGLSQPTFGQRKIEHDIRLKEGEVSLLGGLISSTVTRAVSGLPGLGQIPILRYLFSTEHRQRVETEILVMLTPRVIRLPEFTSAYSRSVAIERGTGPAPEVAPPLEVPPAPPGQPQ